MHQHGVRQHIGALRRTAAENHERPFRPPCGKTPRIDHLGRHLRERPPLRVEQLRINLHAPRVDHGTQHGALPILDGENPRFVILARHLAERIERTDGDERLAQTVAQSLGERHTDAQPRVGTGPLADGYGIQIVGIEPVLFENFIDENADLAGVVAAFVALAQRNQFAVFGDPDRTDVRARFDT